MSYTFNNLLVPRSIKTAQDVEEQVYSECNVHYCDDVRCSQCIFDYNTPITEIDKLKQHLTDKDNPMTTTTVSIEIPSELQHNGITYEPTGEYQEIKGTKLFTVLVKDKLESMYSCSEDNNSYFIYRPKITTIQTQEQAQQWAKANPSILVSYFQDIEPASSWNYGESHFKSCRALTSYQPNVWTPLTEIEAVQC